MAASRSSSRSRRSARKGPRGRNSTPRREPSVRVGDVDRAIKKARLRRIDAEADLARATAEGAREIIKRENNHHIASDGSRQPGLNPPAREELRSVTDAVLDETLEKKLAELRSLVSRMEIIASIAPSSGRAAMMIREQAECGSDTLAPSATKESALEHARNRIMGIAESINISRCHLQESARSVVGYEFEKPKADNPAGVAPSTKSGLGLLFDAISQLAYQAECIRDDVTHLTSAL